MLLEISQNLQENICARASLKTPVPVPEARNFIKNEALAQVFSCKFCEISKNTLFTEHLWTIASRLSVFKYIVNLARFRILEYEINLQNWVTQNDVTLWVTNSILKNKKLHFELLTRRLNFCCFFLFSSY